MKNKMQVSIILTLMMIVSTFTLGTVNADPEEPEVGPIIVEKYVWDNCTGGWVDYLPANLDDVVRFKIIVDYDQFNESGYQAEDIVVKDILPPCLNYSNDAKIYFGEDNYTGESSAVGKIVYWNLTEDYDIILSIEQSGIDIVTIEYNATVVDCGENINYVEVTALEHCSGKDLYGNATATVYIECDEPPCETGIEVEKTVWNLSISDWSEHTSGLRLGDLVDFQIVIDYYDECETDYQILNLIVKDMLPCCLEYNDTLFINTTSDFPIDDPIIVVEDGGKTVYWKWNYSASVKLLAGDNLTIQFRAKFVEHCDLIGENLVNVSAWGCSGPIFYGEDNATVDCRPPVPQFIKGAMLSGPWEFEQIEVNLSDTVRFGLVLYYYGELPLTDIQFTDVLPCILEFKNNVNVYINDSTNDITDQFTVEVSADGKTIWFNSTNGVILESDNGIGVFFDAEVIGVTGECDCSYAVNYANVTGKVGCTQEPNFFMEDDIRIISNCPECNSPPSVPSIRGDTSGEEDEVLDFYIVTSDTDGDQVYYSIKWGDGAEITYIGPFNSNVEQHLTHAYASAGTYYVTAFAEDEHGGGSGWTPSGYTFKVVIDEPEELGLQISVPNMFYLKNVGANIKNIGDITASSVDWTFTISGGLVGGPIESSGTIASITPDASEGILSGDVVREIGARTIDIVATVDSLDYSITYDAFVIGRLVFIL